MMYGLIRKPRVYISGKISGLSKEEYAVKFGEAEKRLRRLGFDVFNPASDPIAQLIAKISYRLVMLYDLRELKCCDCIYLLDNCDDSRGAMTEIEAAVINDLAIMADSMTDEDILTTMELHAMRNMIKQSIKQ